MKTKLLILILIGISLSSCVQGGISPGPKGPNGPLGPSSDDLSPAEDAIVIEDTGKLVQTDYPLQGFTELEVGGFFTAEVSQGEDFRVNVEAEAALVPYLDVFVRGETLYIDLKDGFIYNLENASQRVEVTLPVLTLAQVRDHSTMYLSGFKAGEALRLEATDHSALHLPDFEVGDTLLLEVTDFGTLRGTIDATKVRVEISNHGSLILAGSASQVTGEVMGFSSADLTHLDAVEVELEVDGKSTLTH